jgi:hypothetical protein
VADVNETTGEHFRGRQMPASSIMFNPTVDLSKCIYTDGRANEECAPGELDCSNQEVDTVTVTISQRGILINFTASSISSVLGFGEGTVPSNDKFVEGFTQTWQGEPDPPILHKKLVQRADWSGEDIVKVAAGGKHTISYNSLSKLTRV